jgi:hypothetical protein
LEGDISEICLAYFPKRVQYSTSIYLIRFERFLFAAAKKNLAGAFGRPKQEKEHNDIIVQQS